MCSWWRGYEVAYKDFGFQQYRATYVLDAVDELERL
eukprot:CAMPEP_0119331218 /NCGR_PEP_ID=MMETSP1333-20130426/80124_1 /TAXON_ID=418940 /ORGANISM="Scyphosphaera apsteinii, Strain RCC1455" /LENGTH=35 /DNA_ID= /DNA_START= /DNA_END= /DNA_ORIENTATION=